MKWKQKLEYKTEDWETSLAPPFTRIFRKNWVKPIRNKWKCRTFGESSYSSQYCLIYSPSWSEGSTVNIFNMCMETHIILKRGPQQHRSYLFSILRSTEVTEQPIQNTSKWAGTVNIRIVGSIQCRIHTEVGRTIEQPHCITWKMPVWVSVYQVTPIMEKNASAFFSWASPVVFPGAGCLQWKGKGGNTCGVGQADPTGDPLPPALHLWPIAPRVSPGGQTLNGAVVARTIGLADVPAVCLYWHSQKRAGMPFACFFFARQGQKGEDIPSSSFFPLLL